MDTLKYILDKFDLNEQKEYPIRLTNYYREDFDFLPGELGFKYGAEIGVLDGRHARKLLLGNKGLHLYLVDPYQPYKEGPRRDWVNHFENASINLKKLNCSQRFQFSMDFVREVPKESLDFVYIDGNHSFDFIMQDIIEWSKRVRSGGIVSGHDYGNCCPEVVVAVDTYTKIHKIEPWFVLSKKRKHPNSCPSWFWVKS